MKTTVSANRAVSAFETWHASSAVRARAYAYKFSDQDYQICEPGLWFPEILMPVLMCARLGKLTKDQLRLVHVHHLIHFLDYTTDLEVTHVNRAVISMTHGALSAHFTDEQKCQALKLYTDEGYHALFSKEMADQLARHFCLVRSRSTRIKRLDRIIAACPQEYKHFAEFVIAFVSETIIVQELSYLARGDLVLPVFHMLNDHLHDEAKHSVFFIECWVQLWSNLSREERGIVVDQLVKVIRAFCRPDVGFTLSLINPDRSLVRRVATDAKKICAGRAHIILASTIKALRRTDLAADAIYLQKFQAAGIAI